MNSEEDIVSSHSFKAKTISAPRHSTVSMKNKLDLTDKLKNMKKRISISNFDKTVKGSPGKQTTDAADAMSSLRVSFTMETNDKKGTRSSFKYNNKNY